MRIITSGQTIMAERLFGTDGIRGTANRHPMTAHVATDVAMATAAEFYARSPSGSPIVVIGKDTRISGYMLESALEAGFLSMGFDVVLTGPLPTPAVANITRSLRAGLGVVISASHNPYADNGIKIFSGDGYKLPDAWERAVEARIAARDWELAPVEELGKASRMDDAAGRYVEYVKHTFPRGRRLDGLRVVIDAANGAAYRVAPQVLFELGAEVIRIGCEPNGTNINQKCGATHPQALVEKVLETRADIGLALDGDADRIQLVDARGNIIDGDQVMALIAGRWQAEQRLVGGSVVATVMSNMGLERYLQGLKLGLVRTPVGDRHVVDRMRAEGFNLGGEQSGHIVLSDYSTTGDGLIAALQVLAVLVETGLRSDELLAVFTPMPQLLKNVRYGDRNPMEQEQVKTAILDAESRLNGTGRLLVRPSGTEPLIRVMAEGEREDEVREVVDTLCQVIETAAAA
jgi:phosphoglucosamine mutase